MIRENFSIKNTSGKNNSNSLLEQKLQQQALELSAAIAENNNLQAELLLLAKSTEGQKTLLARLRLQCDAQALEITTLTKKVNDLQSSEIKLKQKVSVAESASINYKKTSEKSTSAYMYEQNLLQETREKLKEKEAKEVKLVGLVARKEKEITRLQKMVDRYSEKLVYQIGSQLLAVKKASDVVKLPVSIFTVIKQRKGKSNTALTDKA
ncbi:hypothetical protein [Deefgea piscis]|uniref:hypothetical protein n=1 Tax=Deefgea piscis TaxID=2739061 RepID=UPI001C8084CD|nr:hypothetical protein [Deefgea piscis]QZA81269.1 hypothetical protein K4H25_00895 [Deefgea piscis]